MNEPSLPFAGMQKWKWDIIPVIAGAALLGLLRWGATFLPILGDTIHL